VSALIAPNRSGPQWSPGDPPIAIAILGCTGSIGTQTLDVVARMPERFRVVALAAGGSNPELLIKQVHQARPELVVCKSTDIRAEDLPTGTRLAHGAEGLIEAATHPDVQILVTATSGHAAIVPTARAIESGKTIALANKETIVCAGSIIMPLAERYGAAIRPVDSEHSAIWQALGMAERGEVERLILTASGGPFRSTPAPELANVTADRALAHPTWSMGGKITIDSATLMNKGLEVIEAHWLFDMGFDRIDVVVHPESVIHSLIEFADGSQLAQLGRPDMRLPIQYALTWPNHLPAPCDRLSLAEIGKLTFEQPDFDRFPALQLCYDAGRAAGPFPAALSAADEVAVTAFLDGRIGFTEIAAVVAETLEGYDGPTEVTLDTLNQIDRAAHRLADASVARRTR
jgi:1-deoxy-D-xylulose-5-phosphate reductoisomerase